VLVWLPIGAAAAPTTPLPANPPSSTAELAHLAEQAYRAAQERLAGFPENSTAAWQFARASFDWAEFSTNSQQRAAIAGEGIAAGRRAVKREPHSAAAHYYLALNLGQLARTRSLGALPLVDEMESRFLTAWNLDPAFDHAGADRCLGLLYRDAPGWPASVGSRSKARKHLLRAISLSPDYPENRLNQIESLLQWGDEAAARREIPAFVELLPKARDELSGETWTSSWADWDARWQVIRTRLKLDAPTPPVGSASTRRPP